MNHTMHDKMKKLNKKNLILPIAILATAGVISLGAVSANAYFGGGERHDDMVKELAVKLGVDETKVSAIFEEMHQEHQQEMEGLLNERLDAAVSQGKITDAQKASILEKHEELEKKHDANRESFQDMTRQERRNTRQTERDELEKWAQDQGVDLEYFMGPMGGHMGKRGGMMDWNN